MTVNYRIITIFASVASAILCAISLAFTITAIVSYRAEDFFTSWSNLAQLAAGLGVDF